MAGNFNPENWRHYTPTEEEFLAMTSEQRLSWMWPLAMKVWGITDVDNKGLRMRRNMVIVTRPGDQSKHGY